MFVAIFIGSMLMYKEIERKTFYLILPKPAHRGAILIGKCLGLTATTILVTLISTAVLILILFFNKDGVSYIAPILLSVFLSTLEAIIIILISMLFSLLTSPIIAAVLTITFFFIGHGGDILKRIFILTDSTLVDVTLRSAYYILPNLEKFNIRNDIVYGTPHPLASILIATLYAFVYAAFLLFVTNSIFKKKDF
jgi:ABC-type transport system involved in multi-copper enzyme maturation permease subunit